MTTRVHFDRKLDELRDSILMMGSRVHAELELALRAYRNLDLDLAAQVYAADQEVNQTRFEIEEECFTLIVTQQPAARPAAHSAPEPRPAGAVRLPPRRGARPRSARCLLRDR